MSLGKRKAAAVFAAVAVVASGAMWAPATAQTPMQCVPVPGGTAGTTVKVGDVTVPVPAISNIRLCVGGTSLPSFRTEQVGGDCEDSCLSVYVGGGALDAGRITVSWSETVGTTTTPNERVVDPDGVGGPEETCVLSTGAPVPANPDCFIAVGVVPPPDELTPLVETVQGVVAGAVTTATGLVGAACGTVPDNYDEENWAYVDFCENPSGWTTETATDTAALTCDSLPDRYDPETGQWYDACTNTQEWAMSFAKEAIGAPCSAIPDRSDPSTGETYDFCTNPTGWAVAAGGDAVRITCQTIPDWYHPGSGEMVDFCANPVGWTDAVSQYATGTTCNAMPPATDDWGNTVRFCDDPVGWLNQMLEDGEQLCNFAVPAAYDSETGEWVYPCTEPGRWVAVTIQNWCGNLCDIPSVQELIRDIRAFIAEQEIKIIWSRS